MIERVPYQFIAERLIQKEMNELEEENHVFLLPGEEVTIRNNFRFINETNFLIGVAASPNRNFVGGIRILVASALQSDQGGFEPDAADLKTYRIRSRILVGIPDNLFGDEAEELEARNIELSPGQFGQLNHEQALLFASQHIQCVE